MIAGILVLAAGLAVYFGLVAANASHNNEPVAKSVAGSALGLALVAGIAALIGEMI